MGALCVLGEPALVEGFGLVGAIVLATDEPAAAWRRLPADVGLVVLTPAAAKALGDLVDAPDAPLSVAMPS